MDAFFLQLLCLLNYTYNIDPFHFQLAEYWTAIVHFFVQ